MSVVRYASWKSFIVLRSPNVAGSVIVFVGCVGLPQGTVKFVFGRKTLFVEFREVCHVFVRLNAF